MEMFEMAARMKFRFPFKGQISVEDLWDLNVTALDTVFKTLNGQRRQSQEESLLSTPTTEDTVLEAQIAIVKHIVSAKQAEQVAIGVERENKAKKQKLMEILSSKQDAALQNLSVEELQKMLSEI